MVGDHKLFQDTKSYPVPSGRWDVAEDQGSFKEGPLEGGRAQRTRTDYGSQPRSCGCTQMKTPGREHF